jgi:fructokinase
MYGGIEAGGTTWRCAVGDGSGEVHQMESFPTTSPEETISRAVGYFVEAGKVDAIGVGCFGPVDVRPDSPGWGQITTTPKPGWSNVDVVGRLAAELDVPFAFDTDVNVAALGESRWGAAIGRETFCYVTVGTGIGAGVIANGKLLHGLVHPELGHIRIPHDRERDPFGGTCPYHGDCLEGLASGEAVRQRWGRRGEELLVKPEVWKLEAEYLALGLVNVICTICPELIIVGGGVARGPQLLPLVREKLNELLAGYLDVDQLNGGLDEYVVTPALGELAGVTGAAELARSQVLGATR